MWHLQQQKQKVKNILLKKKEKKEKERRCSDYEIMKDKSRLRET